MAAKISDMIKEMDFFDLRSLMNAVKEEISLRKSADRFVIGQNVIVRLGDEIEYLAVVVDHQSTQKIKLEFPDGTTKIVLAHRARPNVGKS